MHTQPDSKHFTDVQYQFSGYIRDPENVTMPEGIEQRRMAIYRDLFYNNIEGFIASGFPILRQITSDERWHAMVRDFIVHHHCTSPLFHEISREFLAYLDNERDSKNDPVFIKALCHYEWVELALTLADDEPQLLQYSDDIDYLALPLITSPLAWPLSYAFPVHQISPDFQPEQESDTPNFLLVYRDTDDRVVFMDLNPVSARLIDLVNSGLSGLEAAKQICNELQHPDEQVVIEGARSLINDWVQRGILISAD